MSWTAVVIVCAVCWAIVKIANGSGSSSKKDKALISEIKAEHEQLKLELNTMKDRLIVLEKIVTDEKYQLNKEFNSL